MTIFIRLLDSKEKDSALSAAIHGTNAYSFEVDPNVFRQIPGEPFAYWASQPIIDIFKKSRSIVDYNMTSRQGLSTADDFRFARDWWEVAHTSIGTTWFSFSKGGVNSSYYCQMNLCINWSLDGAAMKAWSESLNDNGHWSRNLRSVDFYFRPGLTWPRRTQSGLSLRVMPSNCLFADKGPAVFVEGDDSKMLLSFLCIATSSTFRYLVDLQMCFGSYEVGVIQRTPLPSIPAKEQMQLVNLARRAWSAKRYPDTMVEISHAFIAPQAIINRLMDRTCYLTEHADAIDSIQREVNDIVFRLYELSGDGRIEVESWDSRSKSGQQAIGLEELDSEDNSDADEGDFDEALLDLSQSLLSWSVGIAFGRFDIRLATGERQAPPEPEPFDPLPAKSPGMLPDGDAPFHVNQGILVDDKGHPHDLARLIESVLEKVGMDIQTDARSWLRKDFFPLHLKQYSKSRRKAPIYWPLATASGGYTLWLYYPALTDQTLFTAAEFVEMKLERVSRTAQALRDKSPRSRDEEGDLEARDTLIDELRELRAELLRLAPSWKPNHDDGVQITAAPLWRMFRFGPWQKALKETWEKLEKGDCDWAHLAMAYWPERVRAKCRTDKSLAIAHDLENLYEPPPEAGAKPLAKRGRKAKD